MYSKLEKELYAEIRRLKQDNAELRKALKLSNAQGMEYLFKWIAAQELAYNRQLLLILEKSPRVPDQQPDDRQLDS